MHLELPAQNWIIETNSIEMSGKYREIYKFNSNFKSTPTVTATLLSPSGVPMGNSYVHIVSVNKKEVDIAIGASIPGAKIQIHAIGK